MPRFLKRLLPDIIGTYYSIADLHTFTGDFDSIPDRPLAHSNSPVSRAPGRNLGKFNEKNFLPERTRGAQRKRIS